MTRDSNRKNLKSEQTLTELINKNKELQSECDQMFEKIDNSKVEFTDMKQRITNLVTKEVFDKLTDKYERKE
jgi:Fe-S-cluster formation regulator IscX/YfhJ